MVKCKYEQLYYDCHSPWFQLFFLPLAILKSALMPAISLKLHCILPMLLCCSRALQLKHGGTYAADLSQAAWRLFRPFLWRWNIKRDPAGYTSNVIRVLHTTERHRAAHARQLIAGTLSFRQLMSPETVCLMKPAKQWIQCEIWLAVGHGRCEGLSRSGPVKSNVLHTAMLLAIRVGPHTPHPCETN